MNVDNNRSGWILMCHGVIKRAITPVSQYCSSQASDQQMKYDGVWGSGIKEVSNLISCEKNGIADKKL